MRGFWSIRLAIVAVVAATVVPCFAAEVAVLRNGFSIRHERREVVGQVTRLYVKADGSSYVDIPTAEIEHYEAAPELPVAATSPPIGSTLPGGSAALREDSFRKNAKSGAATMATNFGGPANRVTTGFPGRPKTDLNQVVAEASGRYQLDPDLVNSVIKAESGFNTHAVSRKGAQGLMQLMPGTASALGVPNAFDPQANVEGGTKYLRELLERYNFDLVKALAAYNAGPQRVEQFRGVPPYHETRAYVARIVKDFNKKKIAEEKAAKTRAKSRAKVASSQPAPGKAVTAPAGH